MGLEAGGLSLVLGRLLLAWGRELGGASLERYLELGGFEGFRREADLAPLRVIADLRSSGLRDRGGYADPVYLKWQRFSRSREPGVLVVDAADYDPGSQAWVTLLGENPFALVEALYTAAAVFGAPTIQVLMPQEMAVFEHVLLNAFEQAAMAGLGGERPPKLELVPNSQPSIFSAGPELGDPNEPALVHSLETWYHIALAFSLGPEYYASLRAGSEAGTRLITLGGEIDKPGLIEAPPTARLWPLVQTMGHGVRPGVTPLALAIDGGMGGFLPPIDDEVSLVPEELAAAGVNPGLSTLSVLPKGHCMVDQTRRMLYRYWQLAGTEPSESRGLITRALRLVVEITRGKSRPAHLTELETLARRMASEGLAPAWPLLTSITYFRDHWRDHIAGEQCPAGLCLHKPLAPCHNTCPAGIDIPSFLAHIGRHEYEQAVEVIASDNPLPYACGLVCPAPCEGACLRQGVDDAVSIRAMKAVAAKKTLAKGEYPMGASQAPSGKRVAVVGSGPAGLTAARFLAAMGHEVEIFEAQDYPGGMLRYGIPAYRLPHEVIDAEVRQIQNLGVKITTGYQVENIAQLRAQGFDAFFLGVGTQLSRMIPIDGADQPFVLGGLDFLKEVRRGENPHVGPRVVVVGGGNVAIDVALSARRQGGKRVDMVCLEKRREMPAHIHEVQTAIAEGVDVHNSWGPKAIHPDGSMDFIYCSDVFDDRGRFNPSFNPERTMTLNGDHIILAIGQATDLACVEEGSEVKVDRGLICADQWTLATGEEGVFSAGDVVTGPRTAVDAVGGGKRAAMAIDAYLRGESLDPDWSDREAREVVPPLGTDAQRRTFTRRTEISLLDVEDRQGNYHQVELGLNDEQADDEAARCLRCDLCIGCGLCQLVCSEVGAEALRLAETDADRLAFTEYTRPSGHCIGCGACSQACPTGAIRVEDKNGIRRTIITGTVVREQEVLTCEGCGGSYAPLDYLNHLRQRSGPDTLQHLDRGICPACARATRAEELAGGHLFILSQP